MKLFKTNNLQSIIDSQENFGLKLPPVN